VGWIVVDVELFRRRKKMMIKKELKLLRSDRGYLSLRSNLRILIVMVVNLMVGGFLITRLRRMPRLQGWG